MADRGEKKRSQSRASERGENEGRQGLGDDQGTRVGSPDPDQSTGSEYPGPSTGTDADALEGSIMEDESGGRADAGERASGAGAEAAQGMHAAADSNREDQRIGGRTTSTGQRQPGEAGWSGSEPLQGSGQPHTSGYGGQGGEPRTSSDQREATPGSQPDRGADSEAAGGRSRLGDEEAGDGLGGPSTSR